MSDEREEQLIATPADFGHFLLERELGHGGMGGVYLARDTTLNREVAIKVMLKQLGDDPAFVERFKSEAQAAAKLNHPNIAQIYTFGTENGMPYIAMELVNGGSLDKEMEANKGGLDPLHVMQVGLQIADGLAMAAEQGLVHGDVKPENVLYDADGKAKLVDFGLAAMQGDSSEIWGTPYYISPEKVQRQKIDFRADMYSLGATLYHALTGVAPFEGADATEVIRARFNGPAKKPSEVRPELPPEIDEVIMRMLEVEPSMRHPTYQSLIGDIKRYLMKARPTPGTTKLGPPKVKIRGAKVRIKLTPEEKPHNAEDVELPSVVAEVPVSNKRMNVGLIVGLVVGGIILLILMVVGGLMWYFQSDKDSKIRAEQLQLTQTKEKATAAIKGSLETIEKYGQDFHEFIAKVDKEYTGAYQEVQRVVPEQLQAAVKQYLVQEPTKDIADAIAYTNELFVAAIAQAKAAANQAAAETNATNKLAAEATKATNVVAAVTTNGTNVVVKADAKATNAVAKVEVSATNVVAAAETPVEGAEAVAEKKESAFKVPKEIQDFLELWQDVCVCRAADIRVQGAVKVLLMKKQKAEALTALDEESVKALGKLSQELVDGLEQIKGLKCVELARRKAGSIKTKSKNLPKAAQARIKKYLDQVAREAAKAAEAAEKAEEERQAAEIHKKMAEEEVKAAKAKFDDLVETRLKTLDWEAAINQMKNLLDDTKTDEGQDEVHSQIEKIECMQALQKLFILRAKDFKFKDGTRVASVDAKSITLVKQRKVKGKMVDDRPTKIDWVRFYGRKDNVVYMNQLINELVMKGRDKLHTGLLPWSRQMFGAAFTLQLLYTEVEGAAEFAPVLVKKAVEEFEDAQSRAEKWFPEVKLEAK